MSGVGGRQPYRKGAAFERIVGAYLRELGALVIRAPASRAPDEDQAPFDLISVLPPKLSTLYPNVTLVECKLNGRLDPGPRKRLVDLADEYGCMAVLAKPSKKKKGEIEFVMLTEPKTP